MNETSKFDTLGEMQVRPFKCLFLQAVLFAHSGDAIDIEAELSRSKEQKSPVQKGDSCQKIDQSSRHCCFDILWTIATRPQQGNNSEQTCREANSSETALQSDSFHPVSHQIPCFCKVSRSAHLHGSPIPALDCSHTVQRPGLG